MINSFTDIMSALQAVPSKSILFTGLFSQDQCKVLAGGLEKNIIDSGVLMGDEKLLHDFMQTSEQDFSQFDIIPCRKNEPIMGEAMKIYRDKAIDMIIKGNVNTKDFMRSILKEKDLLMKDSIVSDCMFYEIPSLKKILLITDPSINIEPSLKDKIKILENAVYFYTIFFEKRPKVAILSYSEALDEQDPNCLEAAFLSLLSMRKSIPADIEGPLSLDLAVIKESAQIKGMDHSAVAGDADIILVPNLLVGNALAKSLSFLTDYNSGGLLLGFEKAVILTSRSAKTEEKVHSLAIASLYFHKRMIFQKEKGS